MRNAEAAITWGRSQVTAPTQGWYRLCLSFVRQALGVDYTPASAWPTADRNAGTAWDRAQFKHRTSNAAEIPAGVPVFWELASVADHVALSLGDGMCLSNDFKRSGKIDVVPIDDITRVWNGQLLGWTEDLVGNRVYTPPPPEMTRGELVDHARRDLWRAQKRTKNAARRKKIRAALAAIRALPEWVKRS